jgi:putative hydrolase of the HAD superfamily
MTDRAPDTILFDLGNVLFPFDWDVGINGFASELNRHPFEIRQICSQPDYSIMFYEFGTGRISSERFAKRLNEAFNSQLDMDTINTIWCSIFREDKKMTKLLKKLSRKYKTFILSDTDILHWNFIQSKFHLEEIVRGTILSFRRGSMKADPDAFEKIISDYKFSPQKTVFIDDIERNIRAAQNAGIQGILHTAFSSTVKELKYMGVVI